MADNFGSTPALSLLLMLVRSVVDESVDDLPPSVGGTSSHLRVFPEMELQKSELTMRLKKLKREQDALTWPLESAELPVIDWETCVYALSHVALETL